MSVPLNPARVYEDFFVTHQFRPFARDLVARAAPQPGECALDVACGTGVVARLVALHVLPGGSVVGLDLEPAMLAVARECAGAQGVAVIWQEGDASDLPFDDGSFDLAFNQQGLQYIPDKVAALREMRRVLAPDGRAYVSSWAPLTENPVQAAVDWTIRERLGFSSLADRFGLGGADTLQILMDGAGFAEVTVTPIELTLRFPSYTGFVRAAVNPDLAETPADAREAIVGVVADRAKIHLGDYLNGAGLRCPTRAYIAAANY